MAWRHSQRSLHHFAGTLGPWRSLANVAARWGQVVRVCLVDDNELILDAFALLLRGSGHEVLTAATGAEGLALVARASPDLVVIDLELPRMRGDRAVAEMRRLYPGLPIILTSGKSDPSPGSVGPFGADVFLAKPFNAQKLMSAFSVAQAVRAAVDPRDQSGHRTLRAM